VGARREGEDPASRFALEPQLARLTPEVIRAAAGTYLDRKRYVRVTLLPDAKTQ
jgi:predicted Zn-dependent peptidase